MDKAIDYFQRSAKLGNRNAKRIFALEYISGEHIEQNIKKGLAMMTECADSGDSMSCYKLGRIYFFGSEKIEKNREKAVEWLTKSADDGNAYAQNMLSNIEQFENAVLANTIFGMFINLSRCIENDYAQKYKLVKRTVDSRLRRMISQKKQSLCIKNESSHSQEQSY